MKSKLWHSDQFGRLSFLGDIINFGFWLQFEIVDVAFIFKCCL